MTQGVPTAQRLGTSQWEILEHIKRHGYSTVPELAEVVELNIETVRSHLRDLDRGGLVERAGRRPDGPGRPEILYRLTTAAHSLFRSQDGELLQELVEYLEKSGQPEVTRNFLQERMEARRAECQARVEGLEGVDRLEEVARILSEEGFMAEVRSNRSGESSLRLCHCPMRKLVDVTTAPCQAEVSFIQDLLGDEVSRVSYIPSGDTSCRYVLKSPE